MKLSPGSPKSAGEGSTYTPLEEPRPEVPTKPSRVTEATFLLFHFLLLALLLYFFRDFYHDDAYISLRYAKNLVEGHGLVWNPGQVVEGYTNFLWIIATAAVGFLGLDLVFASRLLGAVFSVGTILLLIMSRKERYPLTALLLTTNGCFALWAIGGLETSAFTFWIALSTFFFCRNVKNNERLFLNGLCFAVATLIRPEGALFFLLSLGYAAYRGFRTSHGTTPRVSSLLWGFGIVVAPYILWRYTYYGFPLPNTFYVKVNPSVEMFISGGKYVIRFVRLFGLPLATLPLLWPRSLKNLSDENLYQILLLSVFCVYIVCVGGDHMPGFRFFVPLLPIFYKLTEEALTVGKKRLSPTFSRCLLPLFLITNLYALGLLPTIKDPAAYVGEKVGAYIKNNWSPGSTVALNTAGSTPYVSGFLCIDMLGLNNVAIAHQPTRTTELGWQKQPGHEKGDGAYVLSLKPDYIIIGPAQGSTEPWFLGDKDILEDLDFPKDYELRTATILVLDSHAKDYEPTEDGSLTFTYYQKRPDAL
jgi:hypothetical protein